MAEKIRSFFLRKEELRVIIDALQSYITDYEKYYEFDATAEERAYYTEARQLVASLENDYINYDKK